MASRARRWFFVTAVALVTASGPTACFYDWELPSSDGGEGGADASKDATAIDAPDEPQNDAFHDDVPGPADVAADVPPKPCGPCAVDAYCKVQRDQCGGSGVCTPLVCDPQPTGYEYWCTCNGLFKSECDALRDGGALLDKGCTGVPPGAYQCGYVYCEAKTLCVWHVPDDTYECVPEPACAGPIDCACAKLPCDGGSSAGQCIPVDGGAVWTCK